MVPAHWGDQDFLADCNEDVLTSTKIWNNASSKIYLFFPVECSDVLLVDAQSVLNRRLCVLRCEIIAILFLGDKRS